MRIGPRVGRVGIVGMILYALIIVPLMLVGLLIANLALGVVTLIHWARANRT